MDTIKTITYNLIDEKNNSDRFYQELSNFTNTFYGKYLDSVDELISLYRLHFEKNKKEKLRHNEEYFFELLTIGVFWNNYNVYALSSNFIAVETMSRLYHIRRKYKPVKAEVDKLRGKLTPKFLLNQRSKKNVLNLGNFGKLISWLDATGEFREEVIQLRKWKVFFDVSQNTAALWFNIILSLSHKFVVESENALAKYIPEVDNYLKDVAETKKGEENYIFCKRPKTDYYLNIVGAELMNIAFRDDFLATERKAILLPACMRRFPEYCKAEYDGLDIICTACDKKCNVNKYRKLGEELGFETRIIPHSSDFSTWLEKFASGKNIGVIGVACILNLITGGLEMRKLDIPAQCVFLDYCGCAAHWDDTGFPTDLNKTQLEKILAKKTDVVARIAG